MTPSGAEFLGWAPAFWSFTQTIVVLGFNNQYLNHMETGLGLKIASQNREKKRVKIMFLMKKEGGWCQLLMLPSSGCPWLCHCTNIPPSPGNFPFPSSDDPLPHLPIQIWFSSCSNPNPPPLQLGPLPPQSIPTSSVGTKSCSFPIKIQAELDIFFLLSDRSVSRALF